MTDERRPKERPPSDRIDLAVLAPDVEESERVIGAVMARLASRPQYAPGPAPLGVLEIIGRYLAPRWIAAAAALVVFASLAGIAANRRAASTAHTAIATWADRQHVPTNGELLLAFQGYRR